MSNMKRICAPIALFVYAREDHTRRTVEALKRNPLAAVSELIIFSDAPKGFEATRSVRAVREFIRTIDGFKSVTIVEQEQNLGLATSIISGVSRVCQTHGRVVVLEDDLITSPFFLSYMNDALDYYINTPQVAAISGFHPPFDILVPETFFQCDAECWGWATWSRAWKNFNPNGQVLLSELKRKKMLRVFDQEGSYSYIRMLEDQVAGRIDSWAIRWRASVILNNMLSLYPRHSLTHNIGLDGSGTHGDISDIWGGYLSTSPVMVNEIPIVHSDLALKAFVKFNRRYSRKNFRDRIIRKLHSLSNALGVG